MKIGDAKLSPPKLLIYGPAGAGKSALMYTLGARIKVFDFDRGWNTALKLQDEHTKRRQEVELAGPVIDGQPMGYVDANPKSPKAWFAFKTDLIALAGSIQSSGGKSPYQAYGFDSLTTMFECALRFIMGNGGDSFGAPQIQHWGLAFTEVLNMMSIIRTLPGVVVLIAHEQRDVIKRTPTDKDGQQIIEIGIPGKNMPGKIPSYFDEFWYMDTVPGVGNKLERRLQTCKDMLVGARSRLCLPNGTETKDGLEAILKKCGYEFPSYPVEVATKQS